MCYGNFLSVLLSSWGPWNYVLIVMALYYPFLCSKLFCEVYFISNVFVKSLYQAH